MGDYTSLELPAIYDLLASHTAAYTQMLANGTRDEDFEACKNAILQLQAEIDARNITFRSTISENDIEFDQETHS